MRASPIASGTKRTQKAKTKSDENLRAAYASSTRDEPKPMPKMELADAVATLRMLAEFGARLKPLFFATCRNVRETASLDSPGRLFVRCFAC